VLVLVLEKWGSGSGVLDTRADRKPAGLEGSQTSPRRLKLPTSPCRLGSRLRPVVKTPGGCVAQAGTLRRAGRFRRWQLYRLVAGGSRERPNAMFCPSRLFCAEDTTAIELPRPETFPGAACLPTHRAAVIQSGSPPGVWPRSTRGVFATLRSSSLRTEARAPVGHPTPCRRFLARPARSAQR
jgi:hypothetical protein